MANKGPSTDERIAALEAKVKLLTQLCGLGSPPPDEREIDRLRRLENTKLRKLPATAGGVKS